MTLRRSRAWPFLDPDLRVGKPFGGNQDTLNALADFFIPRGRPHIDPGGCRQIPVLLRTGFILNRLGFRLRHDGFHRRGAHEQQRNYKQQPLR